ncbi:MAG: F0F1 ATP synthase subunit delta [Ignavibacteriae bacterium]|nr:F0F1 ATP synthase subunit delta [Ignavibacteriota bacterium]
MKNTRAAYRYALALLGVAEETKQLDAVSNDFIMMDSVINQTREFLLFLKSPIINKEKKKRVLDEVFKGNVSQTTSLFLRLMTTKNRENILPEIIHQFNKLRDERLGILNTEVRSAVVLSKEQQQAIIEQMKKRTGKSIRLKMKQDPSVIGGFMIQYEDTVVDGSVRRQLEVLAERFASGAV